MNVEGMPLKTRLTISYAIPIFVIISLSVSMYMGIVKLLQANHWVNHTHIVIREGNTLLKSMIDMETGLRGYLLTGKDNFLEPYNAGQIEFTSIITQLKTTVSDNPAQVDRLIQLEQHKNKWRQEVATPQIELRKAVAEGRDGSAVTMAAVIKKVEVGAGKRSMDAIREVIADFSKAERELIVQRRDYAQQLGIFLEIMAVVMAFVSFAVICSIGYLIIRTLYRQIGGEPEALAHLSRQIADGDLSTVFSQQEHESGIYLAMKDMSLRLSSMLSQIFNTAQAQASGATVLSTVADESKASLEKQQQAIDQVVVAIEEMQSTASEVASNTLVAADSANKARDLVNSGDQKSEQTAIDICQLQSNLESTAVVAKELSDSVDSISNILIVIRNITDQTNLLALNAAIEAARAGEQGRGFAVVADEVRSLAQNTQKSASEIETVILKVQEKSRLCTEAMEEGRQKASGIVSLTSDMKRDLSEVKVAVYQITDIVSQIASAAEEQSVTATDMAKRSCEIQEIAEQNGAGADKVTLATQELSTLATELNQITSQFKLSG